MLGSKEKLWGPVPECDHHGVQLCQWLQWGIEQPGKPHISWREGEGERGEEGETEMIITETDTAKDDCRHYQS